MSNPTSKASLRSSFISQIQALSDHQIRRYMAALNSGTFNYFRPPTSDWSGDLFDLVGIAEAFKRLEQEQDFQSTASSGGVQGDYILTTLQGDFLAVLERAFRARHQTSVRTRIHAAARYRGHGFPTGVMQLGMQGYLEWLEKQAKEQRG